VEPGHLRALTAACLLLAAPLNAQTLDEAIDLHTAGRLREALQAYRAVVAAGAGPEEAALAHNNACVLLMDLGDVRAALADCREALRLRREQKEPFGIAESLNNLGLALEALGQPAEAERHFREALALNRKLGNAEAEVINLGNLGALALSAGRYTQAMRLYTEAAGRAARHEDEPWAAEQEEAARINQGVVLEKVGSYEQAVDLYKGLLAGSRQMDPRRRAALLVNAGVIYRNLGDPVSAAASFREAIGLYRGLGDLAGLSNAWLNLGLALHLNLARPADAEDAYRQALRLAEESGDRTEEIQDLFYLGRLLLERSRLKEAEEAFLRCLAASEASRSAEGRWSAREGLGRIAAVRGDLPQALRHLETALDEIERVRAGLAQAAWRAGYFGDKRSVYAAAVSVLWRLETTRPGQGYAERAFYVAQRAKARDLLDELGDDGQPARPQQAGELRQRLGGETVLGYFLGEDRLFSWILRRDSLRMMDLGPKPPVLDAVARIHRALAKGKEPPGEDVSRLSRVLLTGLLPGDGPRLRIAPDGLLHYLPFEILEPSPGEPLVDRAIVSYLPSASMLAQEGSKRPVPLRLAGFGAPRISREAARFGLSPLPGAERELGTIAEILGGESRLFLGKQATEKAFRDAVTRGARVVHLATHTVVDERRGRGAAILLTPAGEEDGLLTPREIARLQDRCDLTVLAACRTALGASGEDGRALASLTGSFLAAGSPAVVATLWDVGDAATAAFMEQLYDQLGRGHPPAEALRRAKLRLRADPRWNQPALWSAYVLVGEAGPVVPSRKPWILAAAVLAILLLVLALFFPLSLRRLS
jgi:tetratricopeptide (TPR) repeat protein